LRLSVSCPIAELQEVVFTPTWYIQDARSKLLTAKAVANWAKPFQGWTFGATEDMQMSSVRAALEAMNGCDPQNHIRFTKYLAASLRWLA
jgi:hypothetical protein